jgi:hypothetical protein
MNILGAGEAACCAMALEASAVVRNVKARNWARIGFLLVGRMPRPMGKRPALPAQGRGDAAPGRAGFAWP